MELENPLDQSQGLLRTSLLPGLLAALRFNAERQAGALSLFELGSVFSRPASPAAPGDLVEGVHEWEQLGLIAIGADVDATYAVQAWEVLAGGLKVAGPALVPWPEMTAAWTAGAPAERASTGPTPVHGPTRGIGGGPVLHPGRRAGLVGGGQMLGMVGEVAPDVARAYDLKGRVALLVVDLAGLLGALREGWEIRPVSRYPASDLDMAFIVGEEVTAAALEATLRQAAGELTEALALFDVWRDASLGEGRRSLAYRARLRAPDRTLTDEEVAGVRERAATAAFERHGAVLRRA